MSGFHINHIRRLVRAGKVEADNTKLAHEVDTVTATVEGLTCDNETLTTDNARLTQVFEEVRSERDYLRQVHAAALANTQRLIDVPAPRRWPWQRED